MTPFDHLAPAERARAEPVVHRIFKADGALDLEGYLSVLTDDVTLRIGSQPEIQGKDTARKAIGGLFSAQHAGLEHRLIKVWCSPQTIAYRAEVIYRLKDGRDVALPYVNVLRQRQSDLISDYRIYIDLSPLQA